MMDTPMRETVLPMNEVVLETPENVAIIKKVTQDIAASSFTFPITALNLPGLVLATQALLEISSLQFVDDVCLLFDFVARHSKFLILESTYPLLSSTWLMKYLLTF